MQRVGLALVGVLLLGIGGLGLWHGLHATAAQRLYFESKYGQWRDSPEQIMAAAERAHALYPHNDELCIWTAESVFNGHFAVAGPEADAWLAAADVWCQRGLVLNPYATSLRLLEVRLAERRSLTEAIRKWEAYVDWEYWKPYNHAVLVQLYARAGRYQEAVASLALIEGRPHHAEAAQGLAQAWRDEIASMGALQRTAAGRALP